QQPEGARGLYARTRQVVAGAVRAFLALYRVDGPNSGFAPGQHEAAPVLGDQGDEQIPPKVSDAKCLSILIHLLPALRQHSPKWVPAAPACGQPGRASAKQLDGSDGELGRQFERLDEATRLAQLSDQVAGWEAACMAMADYLWVACWDGNAPPLAW